MGLAGDGTPFGAADARRSLAGAALTPRSPHGTDADDDRHADAVPLPILLAD
jgi:hypothetical protein